ncbi:hypothetical protein D6855_03695 [Butyrivibrio sp. CB08]|uniref:hypothetical protein n=1 Tax=Butyrivibrio sp. CB08 TaxID=2364879 RepID=UPI000EA9C1BB|nr:hypothetical protein [Butyrivibrio sp. CB08]RKM61011.1 hypothetical protein D6855_03695 [Butyrivibrio sp. CB08]
MALKRVSSLHAKGGHNCLKCGSELTDWQHDNEVIECKYCGQQHFVDIAGKSLSLTVVERPELRRRQSFTAANTGEINIEGTLAAAGQQAQEDAKDMETISELKAEIKDLKSQLTEAKKEKKKADELNAELINQLEQLQELLNNTRDNLIAGQKELLKAKKDAYDWQKAADDLAHFLEQLKEQGKW